MNPYKVTAYAMDELRRRILPQIQRLFPDGPPLKVIKRLEREDKALQDCPYTYALLIMDEVIRKLRYHRMKAVLEGRWYRSGYAWLLGLTTGNQDEQDWFFRENGFEEFLHPIRDDEDLSMRIIIAPQWGKATCIELLRLYAYEWGFWIWECPNGSLKLINLDHRLDDIYAAKAPSINVFLES